MTPDDAQTVFAVGDVVSVLSDFSPGVFREGGTGVIKAKNADSTYRVKMSVGGTTYKALPAASLVLSDVPSRNALPLSASPAAHGRSSRSSPKVSKGLSVSSGVPTVIRLLPHEISGRNDKRAVSRARSLLGDRGPTCALDGTRQLPTHLVMHTRNGTKIPNATHEYQLALLYGIRIVSISWVHACVAAGKWVDEGEHFVTGVDGSEETEGAPVAAKEIEIAHP